MKMLMLPSLPFRDASSRYRIYQYIPYLNAQGIKCSVIPPINNYLFDLFYSSVIFFKARKLAFILKKISKIIFYSIIIINRLWVICFKSRKYDVILIHRMLFLGRIGFMETLLSKFNRNIIFDFDDALFEIKTFKKNMVKLLRSAKVVVAGNDYLADYASIYNDNVYIIPTSVDLKTYRLKKWKRNECVTIGWMGNPYNLRHLEFIKKALIRVLNLYKNVYLKIVSDGTRISFPGDLEDRISFKKWRLKEVECIKSFDIGIMPLIPDAYSKGKCGFKIIQCLAVGVPVVCSPVGVNCQIIMDGVNGFFADSEGEWVDKLSILIKDYNMRVRMGIKGRKTVVRRFAIESNAGKWLEILERFDKDVKFILKQS